MLSFKLNSGLRVTNRNTRCTKVQCKRSVFELQEKFPYKSSMLDIHDLIVTSANMTDKDKIEFFEGHGLDINSVKKYYSVVDRLNNTFYDIPRPHDTWTNVPESFTFFWMQKLLKFYLSIVMDKM